MILSENRCPLFGIMLCGILFAAWNNNKVMAHKGSIAATESLSSRADRMRTWSYPAVARFWLAFSRAR
jgi:hypothetical protein